MDKWVDNPLAWILALAVAGPLVRAGMWIGAVNADRSSFPVFMDEIRKDMKRL